MGGSMPFGGRGGCGGALGAWWAPVLLRRWRGSWRPWARRRGGAGVGDLARVRARASTDGLMGGGGRLAWVWEGLRASAGLRCAGVCVLVAARRVPVAAASSLRQRHYCPPCTPWS